MEDHIIGLFATALIQEIIDAIASEDEAFMPIIRGKHIHPTMPKVVQKSLQQFKRNLIKDDSEKQTSKW